MKKYFNISALTEGKKSCLMYALSAVLFSMGFNFRSCWIFSWLFFVPLSLNLFSSNMTSKRVFYSLFCFFFPFYVSCYSWLVNLYPLDFAGLGNVESVLVIIAGLTLIPLIHSLEMSFSVWIFNYLSFKINNGVVRCLAISFGYVFGEFLQSVGYLAFPWARIYVSQIGVLPILQSAKLFGSYFITFIVVMFNCLAAFAIINKKKASKYIAFALTVFVVNYAFGCVAISYTEKEYNSENEVTAAVLQGNVSSYDKWGTLQSSYERYLELSLEASDYCDSENINTDFALIPETAFPTTAMEISDGRIEKTGSAFVVSKKMSEIMKCPVVSGVFTKIDDDEYNSLACIGQNGEIYGLYHKQKLVPFGEFVPYRKLIETLIPFLSDINMLSEDLSCGDGAEIVEFNGIKLANLVCFDSVFPSAVRKQIINGAEIISISTNDSWYKQSAALEQHASHAVMRAIENNRPVVRCANTGISMLIEPTGKIVDKTEIDKKAFLVGSLHKSSVVTPYTHVGDITLMFCSFYLAILLFVNLYRNIRRKAH